MVDTFQVDRKAWEMAKEQLTENAPHSTIALLAQEIKKQLRRCDCESEHCHPNADCQEVGTLRTIYSRVCRACAEKLPAKYMVDNI